MLILLREGVEALLIVMALITSLKASKMKKRTQMGLCRSSEWGSSQCCDCGFVTDFFSDSCFWINREIIEVQWEFRCRRDDISWYLAAAEHLLRNGMTSWKKPNEGCNSHRRFLSMFALSFLAVFVKGLKLSAHAGILPRITMTDFLFEKGRLGSSGLGFAGLYRRQGVTSLLKPHSISSG